MRIAHYCFEEKFTVLCTTLMENIVLNLGDKFIIFLIKMCIRFKQ